VRAVATRSPAVVVPSNSAPVCAQLLSRHGPTVVGRYSGQGSFGTKTKRRFIAHLRLRSIAFALSSSNSGCGTYRILLRIMLNRNGNATPTMPTNGAASRLAHRERRPDAGPIHQARR
jgi:hypothetical protein